MSARSIESDCEVPLDDVHTPVDKAMYVFFVETRVLHTPKLFLASESQTPILHPFVSFSLTFSTSYPHLSHTILLLVLSSLHVFASNDKQRHQFSTIFVAECAEEDRVYGDDEFSK